MSKIEVSDSIRRKFQIGRLILKAVLRKPEYKVIQETAEMEYYMSKYSGIYIFDEQRAVEKITEPVIKFLGKKLDLSTKYLWDCYETYQHADCFR